MPETPEFLFDGPPRARRILALAHGAGAPMDHPFMDTVAKGVAAAGIRVARFEFPYMAKRRLDGKRRGPDREPTLRATWGAVIEALGPHRTVLAGKSMGGRIASMIAAERDDVLGLVCLGYPFHPTGKPDRLRTAHLASLQVPALIVQGTRDPMGTRAEVEGYGLPPALRVQFVEDGDHSLTPRKRSGRTADQNLAEAVAAVTSFVRDLKTRRSRRTRR